MNNISNWVESYTGELYSWAFYKTSDSETSRDLVQDTFLAALEKVESFKGESSPKTWLFSILNHKIIDYYRKQEKQPVALEDLSLSGFFDTNGGWEENSKPNDWHEDNDEHLLDNPEFQSALQKCMGRLPLDWAMCMRLKYLEGMDGKDICQELKITAANFWQILHRAKLNLRKCIDISWFSKIHVIN